MLSLRWEVNNAFLMPKPDTLFFGAPVWQQPCRFVVGCTGRNGRAVCENERLLDEQFCIGARNHVVLTLKDPEMTWCLSSIPV